MKAQMKQADRAGRRRSSRSWVSSELADGVVTLRRLVDGIQKTVPAGDVTRWLLRLDDWTDERMTTPGEPATRCGRDAHGHVRRTARRRRRDRGHPVRLGGHRRDHGGVTFIDLRDREGEVQVVFHPEDAPEAHTAAQELRGEWVVRVTGTVRARPDGMAEPGARDRRRWRCSPRARGDRVAPRRRRSRSRTAARPTRSSGSQYRYLDLRRPEMTTALRDAAPDQRDRSTNTWTRLGFVEVETPLLTRSTPEGARDFLVPSRLQPGTFYALPQSPQQLKQMLMVAGQDRYYQIVRCLRDENLARRPRVRSSPSSTWRCRFVDEEDIDRGDRTAVRADRAGVRGSR